VDASSRAIGLSPSTGTSDRRFFREAYEQEQVLAHLIEVVRRLDSLAEVATLVSARVDSVLHPASLPIFYRAQERSDRFDGLSSSGVVSGVQLSAQPALLRLLESGKSRDVLAVVQRSKAAVLKATVTECGTSVRTTQT
jgi:hypothetical protein